MIRPRNLVPPAQGNNPRQSKAYALFTVASLLVAMYPGTLIGAGIAFAVWTTTRTDGVTRWLMAALAAATAAVLQPTRTPMWSWSLIAYLVSPPDHAAPSLAAILASLPAEILLGPLILVGWQLAIAYRRDTIHGEEWQRFNRVLHRKQALERKLDASPAVSAHPTGQIRLGADLEVDKPFDLGTEDIAQHVFLPGASGSGKTTTLVRLADGALRNGYGVVIVDCKGVGLGVEARELAQRHSLPFTIIDPHDERTLGYDPCTGDAAAIANKLIGAFSFSDEAEIYKHVAMEVLPVICRAMAASGVEITLTSIYQTLATGGMARLGRRNGAQPYQDRLDELGDAGGVGASGYVGLQKRFGALIEGTFGAIFHLRPALDWGQQTSQPRVTYVSLSSMAASEDVHLFGRVITQDLKQLCDQRLRAIARGQNPVRMLIIYDEFAALREPQQVVDLLLQARQARVPLVVSTQYLPEDISILKPVLSAGVLIAHRVEAEDAEVIAAQFGTHTSTAMTAQIGYDEGLSQKGSVRWVEEFNVHPNDLKSLPVGVAAVYARRTQRQRLVRVYR